jgi:hypothetical protein
MEMSSSTTSGGLARACCKAASPSRATSTS